MANININIAAKVFLSFTPVSVELIRNEVNSLTKTLTYSNGTGQTLALGEVLYTIGTPGSAGYLKVSSIAANTLNGSGNFTIRIDSFPMFNATDGIVTFQYDGSDIDLNIDYNSRPVAEDINISLVIRGTHVFTTAEFVDQYTDYDADSLSEIQVNGTTTGYEYDINNTGTWVAYTSGTWVPVNNAARLRFNAADQNAAYISTNPYKVKDNFGLVSN